RAGRGPRPRRRRGWPRRGARRSGPADGRAAGLSPDGRLLALTTSAGVTVYDLATGRPAYRLAGAEQVQPRPPSGDERAARGAAVFTPDGKHLLTLDHSGLVRVWDAATGKAGRTVAPPERKLTPKLVRPDSYRRRVTELLTCPGGSRLMVRSDGYFVFALDPSDWSMEYVDETLYDVLAASGDARRVVNHYD